MKVLITLLILFLGMSIDMSAQTMMTASKKMNVATPVLAQSVFVTNNRPTSTTTSTSITTRGATSPTNPQIQTVKPIYPSSDLLLIPNNPTPVSLPIIRKKKD